MKNFLRTTIIIFLFLFLMILVAKIFYLIWPSDQDPDLGRTLFTIFGGCIGLTISLRLADQQINRWNNSDERLLQKKSKEKNSENVN